MLRSVLKEEILAVAVNRWQWTLGKFRARASAPEVDSIVPCDIDEPYGVFKTVKMMFCRCGIGLGELDTCERNVRTAGSHGPDKFADSCFIFNLHFCDQGELLFRVARADCGIEFLYPRGIGRKWCGAVFRKGDFAEPGIEILFTELVDVRVAIDLDVVACLNDVDAIEHVEKTLLFQRDLEFVVNHVE